MQTFLPFPDFDASAASLDNSRLGKQRVEVLQILRALELPDYGWRNHPAVRMWRGRTPALVAYGLACVREWEQRGFSDTTRDQIAEFTPDLRTSDQNALRGRGLLPSWLGNERFHLSHQSRLVAKNPDYYRSLFPDAPPDLDYVWPEPDSVDASPTSGSAESAQCVWVVRPDSPLALSSYLTVGLVGLGTASGVTFDISDYDLAGIKAALGLAAGRRATRALTALTDFMHKPAIGDHVAVEIEGGARLLVGRITSPYSFLGSATPGSEHRRYTEWERVLPRSAVTPPYSLQDVRPFFPVAISIGNYR
ncbi:MAG: hypothetical protein JWM76_2981 [Pseudonocardiales bacterium]|nr:hypothetical protein [Pseudonocardiales bacterium]